MSVANQLVEMIRVANLEDVAAVDAEIKRLESELSRLRMVREIIAPKKSNPECRVYIRRGKTSRCEMFRRAASSYIAIHGPQKAHQLALQDQYPGISSSSSVLLRSPWFIRLPDGRFDLSNEGRAALASHQAHTNNGIPICSEARA